MNLTTRAALDRTARRYQACGKFTQYYVAAKLRTDPVHADVLALAAANPFGRVIDLGCGYGQLGVALLEAGLADSVLGLDRRAHAAAEAGRAAAGLAMRTEARDLSVDAEAGLDQADTVLLIDVLYQLDGAAQALLLRQAAAAARKLVVIRTADPARQARFRLSRAGERLFRLVWPTSGSHVNAPGPNDLLQALQREGFVAQMTPCSRGTPFANVLIVAARPGC